MEKEISQKIKELVADNKLEEALDLLIGIEEQKGRERHNTLILLKGKLEMLEEQEMADLLEFGDLSREKRKIAHALLKMADGMYEGSPGNSGTKVKGKTAAPWMKYLLFGILGIAALAIVLNFVKPAENNLTENPEEKIEQKDPVNNLPEKNNSQKKEELIHGEKKNNPPPKKDEQTKMPTPPPTEQKEITEKENDILLSGFPKEGQKYSLGDTKFIFKNIQVKKIEKSSTAAPAEIVLSFSLELFCQTSFDQCTRPSVQLIMDEKIIEPTNHSRNKNWLATGKSTEEKLTFVFAVNNPAVRIKLEKHNSPWIRGFRILM